MISEHDIKAFMDQANEAVSEEDRQVEFKEEGEDFILYFDKFLLAYTKELVKVMDKYYQATLFK